MAQQTNLEKKGFEKRQELEVRNDYTRNDQYSSSHKDALSDGVSPLGKGTGHGGHTHVIPSDDKSNITGYDYSQFDTQNGGGVYDIKGRNGIGGRTFLAAISKYNESHEYSRNNIDTTLNIEDGQYIMK